MEDDCATNGTMVVVVIEIPFHKRYGILTIGLQTVDGLQRFEIFHMKAMARVIQLLSPSTVLAYRASRKKRLATKPWSGEMDPRGHSSLQATER